MNKNESSKEKFKRVAERRTRQVLKELGKLANCSERRFYQYDDKDVQKIIEAIENQLEFLKKSFCVRSVENFDL